MKTNVQALRKLGSLSGHLSLRLPLFFTDCSIAKRSKPLSWVCPTFQSSDLCNPSGNATEERDLKGEFFSGLVVRILGFLCHVPGSIPARETEIPQAVRHGQKKKRFKKPTFSSWKPDNRQRLHSAPLSDLGGLPSPPPRRPSRRTPLGVLHTHGGHHGSHRRRGRPERPPAPGCPPCPVGQAGETQGCPAQQNPRPAEGSLGAGPSTPAPPLGRPAP